MKVRIGLETQPVGRPVRPRRHAQIGVEKSVGEELDDLIFPAAVLLFALMAVFLDLGMGKQVIQTVEFGLVLFRSERFIVSGDQTGDVAVLCLDDLLGGDAFRILLAQFVSYRIWLSHSNGARSKRRCEPARRDRRGPLPGPGVKR